MKRYLALMMAIITLVAIVLIPPFVHWHQQKEAWLLARPNDQSSTDSFSPRHMLNGLKAWYKLHDSEATPTRLTLSLDQQDLEDLTAKRDDALSEGWIQPKHKKPLPATLTVDGKRMNASVRLRGNQPDHISADKWSLKVHLKQGARLHGIRRFSLQAPYTRSFHTEAIIADTMRSVGVLAPRIDYVDVEINGNHIGIMQMTEEFDTPLLEFQGRRSGPMLQLDDAHTWEVVRATERHWLDNKNESGGNADPFNKVAWWDLFSGWQSARLKAYGKHKKRRKSEDLNAAQFQWMAFTDNQKQPSDIFDIDAFVDFYIVCEYFHAHNLAQWINARLHFNTITARFEPIAYDADIHFQPMQRNIRESQLTCLNPRNDLARTLMHDNAFASHLIKRISDLDVQLTSEQFAKTVAERDIYYRQKLAADYPWLPEFRLTKQHCRRLCDLNASDFALSIAGKKALPKADSVPLNDIPPVVKAYLGVGESGPFLELRNRIHSEVIVDNVSSKSQSSSPLFPPADEHGLTAATTQSPMTLGPVGMSGFSTYPRIDLKETTLTDEDTLSLQVTIPGLGMQQSVLKPVPLPQPVSIPQPMSRDELLQRYPFFSFNESANELQVETGRWHIDELLILPRDIALVVYADTQLLFAPTAGLVLNGDLTVHGDASKPVLFDASDATSGWYGVFSHRADSVLSIKHSTFNATRGFEIPGWRQRAGLLFYRARVVLDAVKVTNSCADDAINLIRSQVSLSNIQVSNSCSDAIDIDASSGSVSGLTLKQSGGDLLDFSDSVISLTDSVFAGAGDKAISIGEGSNVEISDITISDSVIGLAVKDLSTVAVDRANLKSLDVGLMAFQKKAEYGPASMVANDVDIVATQQQYVLDKTSAIALEGVNLPATPFELSDYY